MSEDLLLMGEFFDSVAHQYDRVHTSNIDRGEEYYGAIAEPIRATPDRVRILDIGSGTGLDLVAVFEKVPQARVECIDLSQGLMNLLIERFPERSRSISVRIENYLDFEYPPSRYDYVLASATLHHLRDDEKLSLFPKLLKTLKSRGSLVLGDFYVSADLSQQLRDYYDSVIVGGVDLANGKYHLDVPTTIENEIQLLTQAGFSEPTVYWQSSNYSILGAKRA